MQRQFHISSIFDTLLILGEIPILKKPTFK